MVLGGPLWLKALSFLDAFDTVQIRYVGTEFRRLVCCIRDVAVASKKVRQRSIQTLNM